MADEKETEKKEEPEARDDSGSSEKLDKVLSALDAACARMDKMEKRMDADDERRERDDKSRKDAARKDEEGQGEDKDGKARDDARKDSEGAEEGEKAEAAETAADKARKDKERKDAAARKDAEDHEEAEREAARKDSVTISRSDLNDMRETMRLQGEALADLKRVQPRARTDADFHAIAQQQSRFDSVHQALGLGPAPIPHSSEPVDDYKLRVLTGLKKFSPAWKDVNLYNVAADSAALTICDEQIFAAAQEAARKPMDLKVGELREIRKPDVTGRVITEFVGPNSFVMGMKASARKVQRFRHNDRSVN